MDLTIVSVSPADRGWRIECREHVPQDVLDMRTALSTAWNLARDVHRLTGGPTAVKVSMSCGDGVMVGYHG